MKKRILSVILASLMVAGTVGAVAVSADGPGVTLPDDKFVTETGTELAKGIAFSDESGYIANPYTGYVSGIELNTGVKTILEALVNANGVEVMQDGAVVTDGIIKHGDKLLLKNAEGAAVEEFEFIFMGNADKNDAINISDASMILKIIAGWNVDADVVAADANADGVVNLSDVTLMLKKIAGWNIEFAKQPVLPGKLEMVASTNAACYKTSNGVGWAPLTLSDGIHWDAATKFNVEEGKYATSIGILCHSLSDNEGELTISVYKWKGDYATTVAAMPIISEKFVDYTDNNVLNFDTTDTSGKGLAEGEYMWRVHKGYDDPDKTPTGVGIYYMPNLAPDESSGMITFLNEKEFNFGPVANIFYSTAK